MFNLNIFKKPSGPESPEPQPNRCHFQHQNGRRCRLPIADETTQFCGTHRDMLAQARTREEQAAETAAITAEIYGPVKFLDSAVAINHVLGNLFRLTLEGRIPQRKAALLTSMCRTLLRSVESARAEITTAKLFPQNNANLLNLLALLNGDEAEPETVAPNSSLRRDSESGRTCSAVFPAQIAESTPTPEHASAEPTSTSAPSTQTNSPHQSHGLDNVIWIGHNLFNPTRSSSGFFKQTPIVHADPSATAEGDRSGETKDGVREKSRDIVDAT